MSSARLLAAVVLVGSSFAFAQNSLRSDNSVIPDGSTKLAVALEPAKLVPNVAGDAVVPQEPLAKLEAVGSSRDLRKTDGKVLLLPNAATRDFVIPPFAFADGTCFAIRSYVVARDSKNSDSTHLVGYSTCVAANKYRIRKVDEPENSGQVQQSPK